MSFFANIVSRLAAVVAMFVLVGALVSPVLVSAQQVPGRGRLCGPGGCAVITNPDTFDQNSTGVVDVIINVARFITFIVAGIAILFLVYGGVLYVTDGGDGKSAEKGKKIVINAVIGLILAIVAYTIVALVGNLAQGGLVNGG